MQARVASPSRKQLSSDRYHFHHWSWSLGEIPLLTVRVVERCVPQHYKDVSAWLGFGLHKAIARPALS